jgi:hypothetical protein
MKKIINFCILAITILTVNLLTGYITDYFLRYKHITNPFKFTAIGMLILVAVFYPVFEFIENKVEGITKELIKKGNNAFGKILGVILVFALLLSVLYCIYAKLWFHLNIPSIAWNWLKW